MQDYDSLAEKQKELETKIKDLEDNPPRYAATNNLDIDAAQNFTSCDSTVYRVFKP